MKAILNDHHYLFIVLIFFLAACNTNQSSPTILPTALKTRSPSITVLVNSSKESTQTPPSTVKSTTTPLSPTHTPSPLLPSTYTTTPLPTITPSITPTFDFSHLVTVTKSPPEPCPEVNSSIRPPDFIVMTTWPAVYPDHFQEYYLDYFNNGGSANALPQNWNPDYIVDLNNDGIPEYVFNKRDLFILTCNSGKYEFLLDMRYEPNDGFASAMNIRDANQDGIPEMLLDVRAPHDYLYYDLLEWDGTQFRSLFVPLDHNIDTNGKLKENTGRMRFSYEYVNSDPLLELAVSIDPPSLYDEFKVGYIDGYPWRREIDYYKWNGYNYVFSNHHYSDPIFRYQAVNDGDWAFQYGDYDKAISYYQKAINDKNLFWYSNERRDSMLYDELPWRFDTQPPEPIIDQNEYPSLAAYSYFRMMLAEIKTGDLSNAQSIYDWLQTNFLPGKPGYVYSELAKIFWDGYQNSNDIGLSCSLTYDFINNHRDDIFHYITSSVYVDGKKSELTHPINFGYENTELKYSPDSFCPSK